MKNIMISSADEFVRRAKRHRLWRRVIAMFSVITILCTAIGLKMASKL